MFSFSLSSYFPKQVHQKVQKIKHDRNYQKMEKVFLKIIFDACTGVHFYVFDAF
jgi:hypothetical protein